jgi:hypothetical protein
MKTRKMPAGGPRNGKGYVLTISGPAIEFERVLNGIKGGYFGEAGGRFEGFSGGNKKCRNL